MYHSENSTSLAAELLSSASTALCKAPASLATRRKLALPPTLLQTTILSENATEPRTLQPVDTNQQVHTKPPAAPRKGKRTRCIGQPSPFEAASACAFTPKPGEAGSATKKRHLHTPSPQHGSQATSSQVSSMEQCHPGLRSVSPDLAPSPYRASPFGGSQLSTTTSLDSHAVELLSQPSGIAMRRRFSSLSVDTAQPTMPPAPQHAECLLQEADAARQCLETKAQHGWFSRCRGCCLLTGNQYDCQTQASSNSHSIPMCAACAGNLGCMEGQNRAVFESQLVHIHVSWSTHGY